MKLLIIASVTLLAACAFSQINAVSAKSIAERNLLAEALGLTLNVNDDWQQPKLVGEIASRYVLKGKKTVAMDALESIEPTSRKAHAFFETGSLCYEGDEKQADALMQRASELCADIDDPADRTTLFIWIGSHYFKNKREEAANYALVLASESAAKIEKDFERAKLECEIAHQYARAGETNAFNAAQTRAFNTATALPAQFLKNTALTAVAKNYATMGQHFKYEALLEGMNNPRRDLIALELAETQQFETAEKALARVTDPNAKAFAILIISQRLVEAGMWDEALVLADAIEVPAKQADCYIALAIKAAEEANELEKARELLDEALLLRDELEIQSDRDTISTRDSVSYALVNGFCLVKQPDRAQEIAADINNLRYQKEAFANIAITQAKAGSYSMAFDMAEKLELPSTKTRALLGIAESQVDAPNSAKKTIALALRENSEVENVTFQIEVLMKADDILCQLNLDKKEIL
ncbi:hypothetical protein P4C99_05280 [Pontiellaceae bacterium B1224]|nr:hypothetical protein [Pontiellaceae bacterium B1224]